MPHGFFNSGYKFLTLAYNEISKAEVGYRKKRECCSIRAQLWIDRLRYNAEAPRSWLRMRIASSILLRKIFPSPIFPDPALLVMALTAPSTRSSLTTISIFTFGKKSTEYSRPRYTSV